MANSYIEYSTAGTGTNGLGQATFSYNELDVISGDDIYSKIFTAGSLWEVAAITSRDTTAKTITLTSTPAGGTYKVRVYRQTTSNALVDFVDGARLTESDLDTAYKQGLFVAQEVSEDAAAIGTTSTNNLTLQGTTTAAQLKISDGSAPATPTGGGVLYVESGALKYKGSSGTATPLAGA